jgi:hypothetical protein
MAIPSLPQPISILATIWDVTTSRSPVPTTVCTCLASKRVKVGNSRPGLRKYGKLEGGSYASQDQRKPFDALLDIQEQAPCIAEALIPEAP